MLEFISLLKQRYQAVCGLQNDNRDRYQTCIEQLILAEAFLRKGQWLNTVSQPLHIAVIGPTQAGKSSLVNVLLNTERAKVSPLAGFTVHIQGFCHKVPLNQGYDLQRYFGRFQQLTPEQLTPARYDCYALSESPEYSPLLPPCILWDTPDFDSVESSTYREGVLRAMALADVLILVVSKEKYADASVWEMMNLLEPLQQPTLICLNKLSEGMESVLIHSLQEKWQTARRDALPPIIPLLYQKNHALPAWSLKHQTVLHQFTFVMKQRHHERAAQAFLQKHWDLWLEPIRAEHQLLHEWQLLVEQTIRESLQQYQRDYLNHPHHYATFQQALAELLILLEIPMMANIMAGARNVLLFPIKKLSRLWFKQQTLPDNNHEIALLNQLASHVMIHLSDQLLDRDVHKWQVFQRLLRDHRASTLHEFNEHAKQYHLVFQHNIEQTAQQLYLKLKEQPLVLNSLRATRLTTDAASIVLSLYTGGIGLHDFIVAPAILSLTSWLAESAIGSYVQKTETDLKRQQLNAVKQLFENTLQRHLLQLPEQLSGQNYFAISPEQTARADAKLKNKRHGLQLR